MSVYEFMYKFIYVYVYLLLSIASILRQIYGQNYEQTSMYIHVQTSIGKNRTVSASVKWANMEQKRYVMNGTNKSREKNKDWIVDKTMKKCLYRHFS